MRESTNYKFNLPDKADQFNLDHWNQNTEKLDETLKSIEDKDLELNDLINNKFNDLLNGNPSDTESLYYKIMLKAHPVGSLYWSSKPTNPAELFGGTWTQIKDKFVLACGDTYSVNATGGNANTTLTTDNLPSHTHGLNNHTHYFTPKGSMASHTHPAGTLATSSAGAHTHTYSDIFYAVGSINDGHTVGYGSQKASYNNPSKTTSSTGAHTHTISGSTGTPSSTGFTGTRATTEGASGNTTATGSGTAFSNMPPYIGKYCWERVS